MAHTNNPQMHASHTRTSWTETLSSVPHMQCPIAVLAHRVPLRLLLLAHQALIHTQLDGVEHVIRAGDATRTQQGAALLVDFQAPLPRLSPARHSGGGGGGVKAATCMKRVIWLYLFRTY